MREHLQKIADVLHASGEFDSISFDGDDLILVGMAGGGLISLAATELSGEVDG